MENQDDVHDRPVEWELEEMRPTGTSLYDEATGPTMRDDTGNRFGWNAPLLESHSFSQIRLRHEAYDAQAENSECH